MSFSHLFNTILEPGLGLAASSLMTLRPLLRKSFNLPSNEGRIPSYSYPLPGSEICTKRTFDQLGVGGDDDVVEMDRVITGSGAAVLPESSYDTKKASERENVDGLGTR